MLLGGHAFFQILSAAIQFKLFEIIESAGQLDETQIANLLHLSKRSTRMLLLGCTALGLIEKRNSVYINKSDVTRLFLTSCENTFAPMVLWLHLITYKPMFHLYESLKSDTNEGLREISGVGATVYDRLAQNPELEKIFHEAMSTISNRAISELLRAFDFGAIDHIVDIGGGTAVNALKISRALPHIRVTVFDIESVAKLATQVVNKSDFSKRVFVQAGNCFLDVLPLGDCYLMVHFCSIWSEEDNKSLFRRCFEALPAGGSVIIVGMMQNDDRSGPLPAAMTSAYFISLATGRGSIYSGSEYKEWLEAVGFTNVQNHNLSMYHKVVIASKGP